MPSCCIEYWHSICRQAFLLLLLHAGVLLLQ
jgi:hypothetical protein